MAEIELIVPGKNHESMAAEFIKEHLDNNEHDIHGGALIEKLSSYDEWLRLLKANSHKQTVENDWVVSSTFFAGRISDGRIVGMVDIRHELNDFLISYGGNIGIGVRPSERGKGYGREILRLALEYCKSIGLKKVMLACYKDNTASSGIIIQSGGVLEREYLLSGMNNLPVTENNPDKRIVQVYWKTF
jgi:predicted acetyltransferase